MRSMILALIIVLSIPSSAFAWRRGSGWDEGDLTMGENHIVGDAVNGLSINADNDSSRTAESTFNADGTLTIGDEIKIGDGTTGADKYIRANNGDANLPGIRYNETDSDWEFSNDGTSYSNLGSGGGGSAIILDLGDDGSNESTDITEIATTGDTNSIFTEPSADKLKIAVGNNWPTADTANAGDSATAFFSSGTIEHERGGLEADVSAYNGLIKISGGTTSSVTDSSTNWDTAYTHSQDNSQAHTDYMLNTGDTATGDYNFDSGTLFIDATANEVGIGTTNPSRIFHVPEDDLADIPLIERSGLGSDTNHPALDILATKTSDMAGAFGATITFNIQDDAAVVNPIVQLHAGRDGADNSGFLRVMPYSGGVIDGAALIVKNDGSVGIGKSNPGTKLDVSGTANATTVTEGGNAVYNSTETPGGELGGTWASPTIDDLFIKNNANDSTAGDITVSGGEVVLGSTTQDGTLVIHDNDVGGDATVTIQAKDATGVSYTLTLPGDDGTSGQVLHTDGSGVLSWDTDDGGAETNSLETTITGILDTEIFIGNGADSGTFVVMSGSATLSNSGVLTIGNDEILEGMLKAVNVAADEDIVTYESTTGDWEYHTPSELISAGDNISWSGTTLNVTAHTTDTNAEYIYQKFFVQLLPLEAGNLVPPISFEAGTNIDMLSVAFDDTADDESRVGFFEVPSDIDSSGTVTFTVWWYSSATTGNVVWFITELDIGEGSSWDATGTAETAAADAVQGTTKQVTKTTWTETVTNLGWTAGELVIFECGRDTVAGDTLTGDVNGIQLSIRIPRT